ncbi:hypothetical protein METH_11935 [Leisingera methylohalidivorans DSM 14336]|uniref:Uncharacterized protein n=1 Tax=Leisingera methylohalidivorans DSM 14336 TaxID=999552 RepID=V9VYT6_9RHOB|nr:hypothetical protein METH_11935 [Leisingera methylohalidivorans DSM 14336]
MRGRHNDDKDEMDARPGDPMMAGFAAEAGKGQSAGDGLKQKGASGMALFLTISVTSCQSALSPF